MSTEAPPTSASPASADERRQPWKLVVASELVVALVGGAVLVGHWWTHPDAFRDYGVSVGLTTRTVERATGHFSVVSPDRDGHVVTINAVRAIVTADTAKSDVSFAVCRLKEDGGIGAVRSLEPYCAEVVPVDGPTKLDLASDDETLVITVSPTRRGRTHVSGVTVEYSTDQSHWWRRGEQTFRAHVTVKAR